MGGLFFVSFVVVVVLSFKGVHMEYSACVFLFVWFVYKRFI